jgi:T5SS/PEP-CTERM-associated repeat protein
MQRSIPFCLALLAAVSLAGAIPLAKADIIPIGDVSPSNPSAWTTSTTGYIGKTATGTLTVSDGGYLRSYYGYIGYGSTATGVVMVDGTRSTWDNMIAWYVGYSGSGTFSITNGGNVSSTNAAQCGALIGYNSGSKGVVTVDGPGSTWSNGSVCIGRSGSGVLSITNGGSVVTGVYSTGGDIGCNPGSAGVVIVDGADSTWTNGRQLYVGDQGSGMLLVTNGGSVDCGTVSGNLYVGRQ